MTFQVVCTVWPGATVPNEDGDVAWIVQPLGPVSDMLTLVSGAPLGFGSVVVAVNVEPGSTSDGALSENGCLTTTGVVPVTPLTVTLIVVAPAAIVFTVPALLTVATSGLLLA